MEDKYIGNQSTQFCDCLELSYREAKKEYWNSLFKNYFLNYSHHTDNLNLNSAQLSGIDCFVYLKNDKCFTVDTKVRQTEYKDMILEIESVKKSGEKKAGWVTDPNYTVDYVFYYFIPTKKCYVFKSLDLQKVWKIHGKYWRYEYRVKQASNQGWTTHFCPVPFDVLLQAISELGVIQL